MEILQKFLMVLVLYHHDGTFTYQNEIYDDKCPSRVEIQRDLDSQVAKGDFIDYDGRCFMVLFKKADQI